MRTNVMRCVLAVSTAIVLSGCYSGGHWTMPWKTSPFSSTPSATPGIVGSPVKPSGIAANSKTNTLSNAPLSNYASVATPPTVTPGSVVGSSYPTAAPSASYPTMGNGYPSATAGGSPTTPSGYGPAYTASTAGVPGAAPTALQRPARQTATTALPA